jgi:RimJ/RimL family protein N-acetyltransferase
VTDWPRASRLTTERLVLEPLAVSDAEAMASLLDDATLHTYVGGEPASSEIIRERYVRQVVGHSPDGSQGWLNWVVRRVPGDQPMGYIQATLSTGDGAMVAEVAWVVGTAYQHQGFAREAAAAVVNWLRSAGCQIVVAHIHPDNLPSASVALALGLQPTTVVVDGEIRWQG